MNVATACNGRPVEELPIYGPAVSAEVYNFLYPHKLYAEEATFLTDIIRENMSAKPGNGILDVACGTGLHLAHLYQEFPGSAGIDISAHQLANARTRLPNEVDLLVGDMETVSLAPRKFDAATCLFGAVSYLYTRSRLYRGIQNIADHVVDGGVAIIEPWLLPGRLNLPSPVRDLTVETPNGGKIQRMNIMRPALNTQTGEGPVDIKMHFMYGRPVEEGGVKVDFFVEEHTLAVFALETFMDAMQQAGLDDIKYIEPLKELRAGMEPFLIGRKI